MPYLDVNDRVLGEQEQLWEPRLPPFIVSIHFISLNNRRKNCLAEHTWEVKRPHQKEVWS